MALFAWGLGGLLEGHLFILCSEMILGKTCTGDLFLNKILVDIYRDYFRAWNNDIKFIYLFYLNG